MDNQPQQVEAKIVWSAEHEAFLSGLNGVLGVRLNNRQRWQACMVLKDTGACGSPMLLYAEQKGSDGEELLRRWLEGEPVFRFPEDEPGHVLGDEEASEIVNQATV